MRKIKIKRIHKNAIIPKYAHRGDVGFDLCSVEDWNIKPGDIQMVRTGLTIQLEYGYEMTVRQRSGLSIMFPNYIVIGIGTVDTSYRGEIMIPIINNRKDDRNFIIKAGDRVAQGVISPIIIPKIIEVDELDETDRGINGFGSTGL